MRVQLVLDIPKLKTTKEAQAFCTSLAEFLVEAITYTVPKKGA